ncbi:protein S-acyltransferase [Malassezia vespertilionis]|uniref:protein S-acyltransferase n=1 Tax=Malassezia vespertilionis TaxID=2020962 RepID=UPI0024B21AA5|nr:protein S-acyltransferase [Malassezia vespertilionis]WFD06655.1 protein S-acyltransferase [Malassezia vespertilionis]
MQVVQVARQVTTFEASNIGRYGFMGGRPDVGMSGQQGLLQQQMQRMVSDGMTPEEAHTQLHRSRRRQRTCLKLITGVGGSILSVVGLDFYAGGRGGRGLSRTNTSSNPFDKGLIANCFDFWTQGQYLGLDYATLYNVPPEGFTPRKKRMRKHE